MNLLLDTTVLIDVLRGRQDRRAMLRDLSVSGHVFAVSTINLAEVYAGMRSGEEAATARLFSGMVCHPVTTDIAERAGLLRGSFRHAGVTLSLTDMLIAATAIQHGLILMTDNVKDFPLPELRLHPLP